MLGNKVRIMDKACNFSAELAVPAWIQVLHLKASWAVLAAVRVTLRSGSAAVDRVRNISME
jgi:hypothetical protein